MKEYSFEPHFKVTGKMPDYHELVIKKEPMLFSASKDFAMKNGGEITKTFVSKFLADYEDWIIDSRIHMLMKGWWPCIPGWHHDDVPRTSTENGQPNYHNPEYYSNHRMVVIGKSSMTEFLTCKTIMPEVKGDTIYKVWNDVIKEKYANYAQAVKSGDVIDFDWQDFHRGVQAEENCWRIFIRASRNTNRQFINEIRTQVQVYLPLLEQGW